MTPATGHSSEKQETPVTIENIFGTATAVADEDFKWDFNVLVNILALWLTYISCTWNLFAFPLSLPQIAVAFPSEADQVAWIAAVPGLSQCVINLFIGEMSDILGRRWFIIVANILIIVGMLVGARATSIGMIIGGQVVVGLGISLGYLAIPLLAEMVPKRSRSIVIGISSGTVGLLASVGAVGIGAFVKYDVGGYHQGWRMAGYVGAGLSVLSLLLSFFFYHPGHRPNPEALSVSQRLVRIDWIGILIGTAGLTLFLMGLQFGGNPYAWNSARVIGLLTSGFMSLVIFIVWEAKFVSFGLFPKDLFHSRNYSIVLLAQFVEGMASNTANAFLVQVQFRVFTSDTVMVNVRCIPYGSSSLIGAALAAYILYKTKETKWTALGGLVLGTLAGGIFSIVKAGSSYVVWFWPVTFLGLSVAVVGVCVSVIATLCTPNELIATAISICGSVRGLGGAVGIVIFSQVLAGKVKVYLPEYLAVAAISTGYPMADLPELILAYLSGDPAAIQKVPGITPALLSALEIGSQQAYARSFQWMWYSMIPFFGFVTIAGIFLKKTVAITNLEVASKVQERRISGKNSVTARKVEP